MTQIDILTYSNIVLWTFTAFAVYYFLVLISNFCVFYLSSSIYFYNNFLAITYYKRLYSFLKL